MTLSTCPACNRDLPETRKVCPFCGVIFEKWKGHAAPSAAPAEAPVLPVARASDPPRRNIWVPLFLLAAIIVLAFKLVPEFVALTPKVEPLRPAPDFLLSTIEGIEYSKASLAGQPVLIIFWAPWCPYCQAELPKLAQYYPGRPSQLRVLAVAIKDSRDNVAAYIDNNPQTFPFHSVYDGNEQLSKAVGVSGVPEYMLMDSHGNIVGEPKTESIERPEFQKSVASLQ